MSFTEYHAQATKKFFSEDHPFSKLVTYNDGTETKEIYGIPEIGDHSAEEHDHVEIQGTIDLLSDDVVLPKSGHKVTIDGQVFRVRKPLSYDEGVWSLELYRSPRPTFGAK